MRRQLDGEVIFGRNGAGFGLGSLDAGIAGPAVARRAEMAVNAFRLVFAFTAANAVFNVLAGAVGLGFPYDTFLHSPADRFGDYFKFILSYPGGGGVRSSDLLGLADLVAGYARDNPYQGREGLAAGGNTHLHVTPLTTLFALGNVRMMSVVDPVALFVVVNLAIVGWLCAILVVASRSRREALAWIGTALLSYPMLFMLTRGNVYAGFTAVLVTQAMILSVRGERPALAAILLALAINIRPNAVVFALPLLVFAGSARLRIGLVLATTSGLVFAAAFAVAHGLYPDYTPASFLAGLRRYYEIYVTGHEGLRYGSSLYGALSVLLPGAPGLESAATCVSLGIAAWATWSHASGAIGRSTFLFLITSVYALASTVLSDYHLLVFLAPLLCLAGERQVWPSEPLAAIELPVLLSCCVMLAPKNYAFADGISYQVVLNPVFLLAVAFAILAQHARMPAVLPNG